MSDNNTQTASGSFKISMGSVIESDIILFRKESAKFYKIVFCLIIVDFSLTEFIFVNDCLIQKEEKDLKLFFILSFISLVFFILLLIFLYLKKSSLTKIARFSYLIIGIGFFIYKVVEKMLDLNSRDYEMDSFDYILFVVLALSIIPRITCFLYIRFFERSIIKMEAAALAEEHEMFIEKVANKLDRSTDGNRILEKEIEKQLEKEDEEIIIKANDEKNSDNKKKNENKNENKKKENGDDKEENAN